MLEKGIRNIPELKANIEQLATLARNHFASKCPGPRMTTADYAALVAGDRGAVVVGRGVVHGGRAKAG